MNDQEEKVCIKCNGEGRRLVYLGRYGGYAECRRCDGTGVDPIEEYL